LLARGQLAASGHEVVGRALAALLEAERTDPPAEGVIGAAEQLCERCRVEAGAPAQELVLLDCPGLAGFRL
jgi:hypothetical protein